MTKKNPFDGIKFKADIDCWCIGSFASVQGKVYELSMSKFTYGSSIDHPIESPKWKRAKHLDDWQNRDYYFTIDSPEIMASYFTEGGPYQKNFIAALPQLAKLNKKPTRKSTKG